MQVTNVSSLFKIKDKSGFVNAEALKMLPDKSEEYKFPFILSDNVIGCVWKLLPSF